MNDNPITLAMIGRLLRRRWPVFVVLAVLGGLLGLGSSLVLSPGYAAGSKVLLQGDREKGAVAGEVQIATSMVVLERTAVTLNWGLTGRDLQRHITASELDGNVIQIMATSSNPEQAQQLADAATREYINFSSQIVSDAAEAYADANKRSRDLSLQRLDEAKQQVDTLSAAPVINSPDADGVTARADLDTARSTVEQLTREIEAADEKQKDRELETALNQASLRVIEPPSPPAGLATPTPTELIVGGGLLLPLIGILAHLVGYRVDRRVRPAAEIAAILGAPVLAHVEVAGRRSRRRLAFLHDDRLWASPDVPVTEDEQSRVSRYRRALAKVRAGSGSQRVLALAPLDDPSAVSAVSDLAVALASGGIRVSVNTGDEAFVAVVQQAGAELEQQGRLIIGDPAAAADLLLQVVLIEVARPAIPEGTGTEPVVLFTSVGTRSTWELAAIAGACVDAERRLAGAVIVEPRVGRGGMAADADLDLEFATMPMSSP